MCIRDSLKRLRGEPYQIPGDTERGAAAPSVTVATEGALGAAEE